MLHVRADGIFLDHVVWMHNSCRRAGWRWRGARFTKLITYFPTWRRKRWEKAQHVEQCCLCYASHLQFRSLYFNSALCAMHNVGPKTWINIHGLISHFSHRIMASEYSIYCESVANTRKAVSLMILLWKSVKRRWTLRRQYGVLSGTRDSCLHIIMLSLLVIWKG